MVLMVSGKTAAGYRLRAGRQIVTAMTFAVRGRLAFFGVAAGSQLAH